MPLQVLAILVLGLMCGSELNVAAFGHPTLNRQPLEVHTPVRSSLAVLFGRVMPFWMADSTLLNILLLLPFAHLNGSACAAISCAIQIAGILFSFVAPVPINNRIAKWTPNNLTGQLERRGSPLGPLPLAADLWVDCCIRNSHSQCRRALAAVLDLIRAAPIFNPTCLPRQKKLQNRQL